MRKVPGDIAFLFDPRSLLTISSAHAWPKNGADVSMPAAGEATGAARCSCGCVAESTISEMIHQLAESLGRAIDAKDPHTLAHSEEVALVAQTLAQHMGLGAKSADIVHVAGHLHDVGKIGLPDAVLSKPGKLEPKEWDAVKAHPVIGAEILRPLAWLRDTGIVEMVLHHHERFDGRGYPDGLSGRRIPLGARIISLADSLSAMLQERPYRPAMPFEAAAREIVKCSRSQFDPEVVEAFVSIQDKLRDLTRFLRTDPARSGLVP